MSLTDAQKRANDKYNNKRYTLSVSFKPNEVSLYDDFAFKCKTKGLKPTKMIKTLIEGWTYNE